LKTQTNKPKQNNLITRIISGLIFLGIFLAGIFIHPYLYAFLFTSVMLIAINEMFKFTNTENIKPHKIFAFIFSALFFMILFLAKIEIIEFKYLALLPILLLVPFIIELYKKHEKPILNLATTYFAIIYIAIPISMSNFMVFPKANNHEFSYQLLLGMFLMIWSFDTGAYFTGSAIGKHKLFERISPKKSWEGVFGGYVLSALLSIACYKVFGILEIHEWLTISVIVSTFSIFGDLVESLFKRSVKLKDSGTIMPGHGGMLDRIDSSLFSIPAVVTYLFLTNNL